jgi:hypothetical protein
MNRIQEDVETHALLHAEVKRVLAHERGNTLIRDEDVYSLQSMMSYKESLGAYRERVYVANNKEMKAMDEWDARRMYERVTRNAVWEVANEIRLNRKSFRRKEFLLPSETNGEYRIHPLAFTHPLLKSVPHLDDVVIKKEDGTWIAVYKEKTGGFGYADTIMDCIHGAAKAIETRTTYFLNRATEEATFSHDEFDSRMITHIANSTLHPKHCEELLLNFDKPSEITWVLFSTSNGNRYSDRYRICSLEDVEGEEIQRQSPHIIEMGRYRKIVKVKKLMLKDEEVTKAIKHCEKQIEDYKTQLKVLKQDRGYVVADLERFVTS